MPEGNRPGENHIYTTRPKITQPNVVIEAVEDEVNAQIRANMPTGVQVTTPDKVIEAGALALADDYYFSGSGPEYSPDCFWDPK